MKVFFRALNTLNAASESEKGEGTTFSYYSSSLTYKLCAACDSLICELQAE